MKEFQKVVVPVKVVVRLLVGVAIEREEENMRIIDRGVAMVGGEMMSRVEVQHLGVVVVKYRWIENHHRHRHRGEALLKIDYVD